MELDRRVQRTLKLLSDALEELILEKDYERIIIQDITDRANLNRTTFYLHFRDKNELLLYTVDQMLNNLLEESPPPPQSTQDLVLDHPPVFLVSQFKLIREKKDFFSIVLSERGIAAVIAKFFSKLASIFEDRLSQTEREPDKAFVPEKFVSSYFSGALLGVISWWVHEDTPCSSEDMAKYLIEIMVQGIYPSIGMVPPLLSTDARDI